jgi:hypothetical protein
VPLRVPLRFMVVSLVLAGIRDDGIVVRGSRLRRWQTRGLKES